MVARGPLDAYLARRERLVASATPGTRAARELSDLTDEAIAARAAVASSCVGPTFALFALGGYGARRLLPGSDIDLLIVSRATKAELEPLVREVLYPLWDAGLAVGHQVRSPVAQLSAVRDDLHNATGFMSARMIAGDAALGTRVLTDTFQRMRKDARALRKQVLARERPGSPYLLEPDLKEGAGAQRDLDEIAWHAALRAGRPRSGLEPLTTAGLLTASEAAALAEAQEALTAARWRIHLTGPRAGNLLSFEAAGIDGLDAQAVQTALEHVHHTLLALRIRLSGGARMRTPGPDTTTVTLEWLRELASGGEDTLAGAERAAYAGALEDVLPGFRGLMALRRPALSHRYTVGAHSLRVAQAAGAELEILGPERVSVHARDAALVASLAHDVGKRETAPGHAVRGVAPARDAALAFGLGADATAMAGTLVEHHLLLSDLAAHADLADEDAILAAAARLGDARLVAPLFALTAADMRSTGPEAWTPWRASLVGEAAAKLERALLPDEGGAGIVAAAETTRAAARRLAASAGASRSVLTFVDHAPLHYLARRDADDVLRDARLVQQVAGPGAPGRFSLSIRTGPADGVWLVDMVTRDRPGLFAIASGVLALSGLDTLSAEAHTDASGIALDTFAVISATHAPVDSALWNSLERHLGLALAGRLDLDTRLAERRRHYPSRAPGSPVAIRTGPRGAVTTPVTVSAPDRVGLLHDLAHAIETSGYDIRRARISTLSGMASDTFELADAEGAAPAPEELANALAPLLHMAARA